jgi:hypothetical protein
VTGWQLVTLLAALFNTGAIVYWQRANEARLDMHAKQISYQQALLSALTSEVASELERVRLATMRGTSAEAEVEALLRALQKKG